MLLHHYLTNDRDVPVIAPKLVIEPKVKDKDVPVIEPALVIKPFDVDNDVPVIEPAFIIEPPPNANEVPVIAFKFQLKSLWIVVVFQSDFNILPATLLILISKFPVFNVFM